MSLKDAVIEMIRALPEDATWDDMAEAGYARFGDSAGPSEPGEWDDEFVAEINRRVEDLRSGKTVGIPAEEVMRKLREKYG